MGHSQAGCTRLQLFTVLLYQDAAAGRQDATLYNEETWGGMQLRVTRHAVVANVSGARCAVAARGAVGQHTACAPTACPPRACSDSNPAPALAVAAGKGAELGIELDSRGQEVTPTPPLPACLTRGGATGQAGALYWRFFPPCGGRD